MRLREATDRGRDVEEELERLQAEATSYPATSTQLLALRSYLAELMREVPRRWAEECQGLTNYVLALDEAARWREAVGSSDPVACVTFNYDTLLEDAVSKVYGHRIDGIDSYLDHDDVKVLKPHGSVNWRRAARAELTSVYLGKAGLHRAIDQAADLEWLPDYAFRDDDRYQDPRDPKTVLLPALSIPVQQKIDFMMPVRHRQTLAEILARTTVLIAVGWRARERHFLKLVQEHLPASICRLVTVAESEAAAKETVDNLWPTGRFSKYAMSTEGFSGFVGNSPSASRGGFGDSPRLRDVLSEGWGVWVHRGPGRGLVDSLPETSTVGASYIAFDPTS
ncbi:MULTISPECIES: hypothetical protein [unclassified Aeromicrobium]|uniref:hypothetical protein n=1 Tax=unclassified Aeromicrobium TaxID=2633570 RepID=UPI00396B174F